MIHTFDRSQSFDAGFSWLICYDELDVILDQQDRFVGGYQR